MTASDDDRAALVAFTRLPEAGPARIHALVGDDRPSRSWARLQAGGVAPTGDALRRACRGIDDVAALLGRWIAAARAIDPEAELAAHVAAGITVLQPHDEAWPFWLDPDPPAVAFVRGDVGLLEPDLARVAIVGTRRCSSYGISVANELGAELARHGLPVVSGLAAGIDGAAHVGALAAGAAPPVGVVATGLDVVYPRGHRQLWQTVAERGALLSEEPLGTPPARWRFPARNRLVASLARAVVVVESAETGGSMHTVDEALRRDVPVFAVPGPIGSRASSGTNRLLAEGATPLCDVRDVLLAIGMDGRGAAAPTVPAVPPPGAAGEVLDAMGWKPATLDQLVLRTGLGLGEAAMAVDELETAGWVAVDGGWVERRR
jgi:DNA processing protein